MTSPSAPTVAVRGESTREVDPEIAEFTVTVNARDKDRATTLARLADRVAALRTILDGYAAAIEKRETSRMSVYAETKRSGEKVTAYVGNATTSVTVTDLDLLGEMMLRVADIDQTSVNGPFWSVRPGSPVYREARHAAIADAVTRAKEYAEALGARVIGLVELTDAGMSGRLDGDAAADAVRPKAQWRHDGGRARTRPRPAAAADRRADRGPVPDQRADHPGRPARLGASDPRSRGRFDRADAWRRGPPRLGTIH